MAESIIFLIFVLWGFFNCRAAINGWWNGQKVYLTKIPEHKGSISRSSLYSSGIDKGDEEGR